MKSYPRKKKNEEVTSINNIVEVLQKTADGMIPKSPKKSKKSDRST